MLFLSSNILISVDECCLCPLPLLAGVHVFAQCCLLSASRCCFCPKRFLSSVGLCFVLPTHPFVPIYFPTNLLSSVHKSSIRLDQQVFAFCLFVFVYNFLFLPVKRSSYSLFYKFWGRFFHFRFFERFLLFCLRLLSGRLLAPSSCI